MGELISMRQMYMLQGLSIIMDDILEQGSTTRARQMRTKEKDTGASLASTMTKLAIQPQPQQPKPTLSDLVDTTRNQQAAQQDNLSLLLTEPVVLAHAVSISFFSRPELVPDQKGRSLPVHTDKYISGAVLKRFMVRCKRLQYGPTLLASWNLELLNSTTDKFYQSIILQEISNICHLEFARAQAVFKRQVQIGSGIKCFKRMSNSFDKAGNPRVNIKSDLMKISQSDPHLHHLLLLCQPETTASKTVDWLQKLGVIHDKESLKREEMTSGETEALYGLAIVVSFIKDLCSAISVPALSHKKAQLFVTKFQGLEAELNKIKDEVDLRDFAVPIDNLLEPGMAEGALTALEKFVVDMTGTKMGFLYQGLIDECLSNLQS